MDETQLQANETETRFRIADDSTAEWTLRKIAEEEAERDRLIDVCQHEIDAYEARIEGYIERCNNKTANLKGLLAEYFATVPHRATKTQEKYELPSGSLVMKKSTRKFDVDKERLTAWLVDNHMDEYYRMIPQPLWCEFKKHLTIADDGSVTFNDTGEVMDANVVQGEYVPQEFRVEMRSDEVQRDRVETDNTEGVTEDMC